MFEGFADSAPIADLFLRGCAAFALAAGSASFSYGIARRLGRLPLASRLSATLVVQMWGATLSFHVLLRLGLFTLPAALCALAAWAAVLRLFGVRPLDGLAGLTRDFGRLARIGRRVACGRRRWAGRLLALTALLVLARSLIAPLLSWDAITYHGPKAAMWVQEAGPTRLAAPGGWSIYAHRLAGGDVFLAWPMLVFRSDLYAPFVSAAFWLAFGFVLYALGRELRVRGGDRLLVAAFVLTIPASIKAAGSGMVEPALNVMLGAGLLFALRHARTGDGPSLLLSMMAMGLACGTKLTAVPVAGFLGLAAAVGAVSRLRRWGSELTWLLCGGIAAFVAFAPWLIDAYLRTGYPLSPEPVKAFGVTFGLGNELWDWYLHRPELKPYTLRHELWAFFRLFDLPTAQTAHAGLLTAPPLVIGLVAAAARLRSRPAESVLVLGTSAALLLVIYAPTFSVTRILWADSSGRFVVAPAAFAALAAAASRRREGSPARLFRLYLAVSAVVSGWFSLTYGWAGIEWILVPLVGATLRSSSSAPSAWTPCSGASVGPSRATAASYTRFRSTGSTPPSASRSVEPAASSP